MISSMSLKRGIGKRGGTVVGLGVIGQLLNTIAVSFEYKYTVSFAPSQLIIASLLVKDPTNLLLHGLNAFFLSIGWVLDGIGMLFSIVYASAMSLVRLLIPIAPIVVAAGWLAITALLVIIAKFVTRFL